MDGRIRLVIVDDHDLMRQTWKMVLQRDSRIHVIAECTNGQEAVDCAAALNPDVMLMDVNMSPINGFEATSLVTKANSDIKVIGLSINNLPTYAKHMLDAGAKGYVTKNSSPEEMIDAIMIVARGQNYICKEVKSRMQELNR